MVGPAPSPACRSVLPQRARGGTSPYAGASARVRARPPPSPFPRGLSQGGSYLTTPRGPGPYLVIQKGRTTQGRKEAHGIPPSDSGR
jgi:hypothetical protein